QYGNSTTLRLRVRQTLNSAAQSPRRLGSLDASCWLARTTELRTRRCITPAFKFQLRANPLSSPRAAWKTSRLLWRPGRKRAGRAGGGLANAVKELGAGAKHPTDPPASFDSQKPLPESPATPIRSAARLFTSEVEDKPWFCDRNFWKRYLSMLVSHRFNRFSL